MATQAWAEMLPHVSAHSRVKLIIGSASHFSHLTSQPRTDIRVQQTTGWALQVRVAIHHASLVQHSMYMAMTTNILHVQRCQCRYVTQHCLWHFFHCHTDSTTLLVVSKRKVIAGAAGGCHLLDTCDPCHPTWQTCRFCTLTSCR